MRGKITVQRIVCDGCKQPIAMDGTEWIKVTIQHCNAERVRFTLQVDFHTDACMGRYLYGDTFTRSTVAPTPT